MKPPPVNFEGIMRIRVNKKHVFLFAALAITTLFIILYHVFLREKPCSLSYLHDASVNRAMKYCNSPKRRQLDQEGTVPSTEDGYKLLSVHAVIRHGDRNSMHSVPGYQRIQLSCEIQADDIPRMHPIMTSYKQHMTAQQKKGKVHEDSGFGEYGMFPDSAYCGVAVLTPIGAAQHVQNGDLMDKRYREKLGLESDETLYESILVRSTTWSRCYQSALALMYGLLGDELDVGLLKVETAEDNRMCSKSTPLPCTCPVIDRADIDRMSPTYRQRFPDVTALKKTSQVDQHFSEVFDASISEMPPVGNLFDLTMAHVCHHASLPAPADTENQCLAPWAVGYMYDILEENGRKQARDDELQKISRLKMLPLLTEIQERMIEQAKGETKLKFVLYSGHDTTIDPLTLVLGFGDGVWCPFASRIVFELYQKGKASGESKDDMDSLLFIKVLFNGRNVTPYMDWCSQDITDDMCPYETFKSYVENGILESISEVDYMSACGKMNL